MFSLLGVGAHGQDILEIAKRSNRSCVALFDDNPAVAEAPPDDLFGYLILGSNYPQQRKAMAERFVHATAAKPLIDPSAIIGSDCHIGDGSVIAPFALLLTDVTLGRHCHLNYGVKITRATIGDFTTLSPSATICGDVTIGDDCLIGASATICDRVTIGNNVVVGAGAVVPPLSVVPDNERVLGVWKNARDH